MNLRKFFTPRVHVKYYFHKDTSRMTIVFVWFNIRFIKKTFKISLPGKAKKKTKEKKLNKYFKKYAQKHYKQLLKIIEVDYFNVTSQLGIEDAAFTALGTGMLYTLYGGILGILNNFIALKNISIDVKPVYNRFYFDLNFRCILKIKMAHAIKEIFRFIIWTIKEKMEALKNERTSNMQSYEHGYAKH